MVTILFNSVNNLLTRLSFALLDIIAGFLLEAHPEWNVRQWSNTEIRKFGQYFKGTVLNVSAWKDRDKERGYYKDYFPNAESYRVSNATKQFGSSGYANELLLDLEQPLSELTPQFELVFAHTVLEHIYDSKQAIDNLAMLSCDSVMLVVPFMQCLHWYENEYYDYWRYSPFALERAFRDRDFTTLYCSWNQDTPLMNTYIFFVASRYPERYQGIFPNNWRPIFNESAPGQSMQRFLWPKADELAVLRRFSMFVGRYLSSRNLRKNTKTVL